MAKKNPRVSSVGDMRLSPQVRGVGSAKRSAPRDNTLSRDVQERGQTAAEQEAIEMAKLGNDTILLPYQPTPSINPSRPRTLAAGYTKESQTLRVRFRDGEVYEYFDVPYRVWRNFKRVKSPGRAINRTLNQYEYSKMDL